MRRATSHYLHNPLLHFLRFDLIETMSANGTVIYTIKSRSVPTSIPSSPPTFLSFCKTSVITRVLIHRTILVNVVGVLWCRWGKDWGVIKLTGNTSSSSLVTCAWFAENFGKEGRKPIVDWWKPHAETRGLQTSVTSELACPNIISQIDMRVQSCSSSQLPPACLQNKALRLHIYASSTAP